MNSERGESSRQVADSTGALAAETLPPASIVNNLGAIVIVLDGAGRITWVNNSWSAATGIPLDDALGKPLLEFVVGQSEKQRVASHIDTAVKQQQPASFDCSITCREGANQRIKWSFTVTHSDADGGLMLTGAGVDVTELYEEVVRLKKELGQKAQNDGGQTNPVQTEKRSCERVPFEQVVHVAPVVEGKLPGGDTFKPVRCKDISQAGFSFFLPERPNYSELVATFGNTTRGCMIHAKIAHATLVELNGHRLFVVGCDFKSRVEKHYAHSAAAPQPKASGGR